MIGRWIPHAALAAMLAGASACSSSPAGCQSDLDCQGGEVCQAHACEPAGGTSGGSTSGRVSVPTTGTSSSSGAGTSASGTSSGGRAGTSSGGGSTGAGGSSAGTGTSGSSAGTTSSGTSTGAAASSAGTTSSSTGAAASSSAGGSTGMSTTGGAASASGGTTGSASGSSTGSSSGGTSGGASLGAACGSSNDCPGGVCLPASDDWDGGYCSALCGADAGCDPSGVCQPNLFDDSNDLPVGVCLLGCGSSSGCRAGYFCDTSRGPGVCVPQDCRVAPAACAGTDECNEQTGGCTATLPASGYPASFPPPPQVVNANGPILSSPKIVALLFSNDDDATAPLADIVSYFQGVGQTDFWQALSEYGVGPPGEVIPVMLGQAAPAAISDDSNTFTGTGIQQLLAGFISAGTAGTPAPDANTVYALIFPTSTVVTLNGYGSGNGQCTFGGYHSEMQLADGGASVPYIVMPRCPGSSYGFPNDLASLTAFVSHELAEATTDPFPYSNPAWWNVDPAHEYFTLANNGSEIADMCENDPQAFWFFSDFAYMVQRIWSNAAAAAGLDPCVPAFPGETFFGAPPVPTGTASYTDYNGTETVDSVNIAVGKSGTVTLDLYSDAPDSAWTVEVADYQCIYGYGSSLLGFTLAPGAGSHATCQAVNGSSCVTQACSGSNGDTIQVTIQVLAAGSSSGNGEPDHTEMFGVHTSQGTGSSAVSHLWWGVVGS
ncbi:MAG TPA: hypothetical protein VMB50_04490 [Myxococcales bacterium]|nr:hypothetical protein [Myxococcales bacterium]